MSYALAKENEAFIDRMLKLGRFNNQSEVVREALRRMEREEAGLVLGEFIPAPVFASVQSLFREFEAAADQQALNRVEELDGAIAALGLRLRSDWRPRPRRRARSGTWAPATRNRSIAWSS